MSEINEAAKIITESIDPDAKVIFGAAGNDNLRKGEIKITVIATGFEECPERKRGFGAEKNKAIENNENKEGKEEKPKQETKKRDNDFFKPKVNQVASDEEDELDIPAFIRRKMKS